MVSSALATFNFLVVLNRHDRSFIVAASIKQLEIAEVL